MFLDILKGILIGICASAPIGPIMIFVMQKSLSKGHYAGFITGLGATVVDTIYAIIAIFALAAAQSLLERHQVLILLVGGVVLVALGVSMALSNPFRKTPSGETKRNVSTMDFIQSIIMAISNPGAIFVMLTLFAFFGITDNEPNQWRVAPIILSVALGTAMFWFGLSWFVSRFRSRMQLRKILWFSRLTGIIVIVIGLALLGQGIFMVVFKHMSII